MTRGRALWWLALLGLAACLRAAGPAAAPRRVVSLVPSLSETAAALGAEEQLVGRSRYCRHPPSLLRLPELGGYLDPAWERLLALEPDLVLLTPESRDTRRRLEQLGLPVLALPQNRLEEALRGIPALGRALGRARRGEELEDSLRRALKPLRGALRPSRGGSGPSVLLVADRSPEPGAPRDLWVIGRGSWLADLLEWLGARNAAEGLAPAQPMLSREGLQQLDPDWIIELWPQPPAGRSLSALEADWRTWPELRAVAAGRVRALSDDCLVLPGPRLARAAELLRATLAARPAGRAP